LKTFAALTILALAAAAQAQESTQQAPVLPMADTQAFICSDGQFVSMSRDETAGVLRVIRGGETLVLQEQVGRKPARFVRDSSGVDLDGNKATIIRGFGNNARPIATCNRVPDAPAAGMIWGTLVKLDRMALPAGTRAKVLLVDAARADAPAVELGSTLITTVGNQVPLSFFLTYDPARTAAPASPMLQARIEDADGRLMYITDTANPIPTTGPAPSPIELKLIRTGAQ
jgi:putative lipoprotein